MDGKICLAPLKRDTKMKDVPVVIYTTSSSQKHKEEIKKLGAAYFLTKPTSFKKLCDEIKKVVETVTGEERQGLGV